MKESKSYNALIANQPIDYRNDPYKKGSKHHFLMIGTFLLVEASYVPAPFWFLA